MSADAAADVTALKAAADRAMMAADPATARELFRRAVALEPRRVELWMGLAACERALGEFQAALEAIGGALNLDPRSFPALLMKASLKERLGAPHEAGADYGVALTQAPAKEGEAPPAMRAAVAHAREVHARYQAGLGAALASSLGELDAHPGPVGRRLTAFVDQFTGRRRVYHSEPVQFRYPGLPEIEFLDREAAAWIDALEAATPDVQAELADVMREDEAGLEPYVRYPDGVPLDQWAELNRSLKWSAYHLWLYGAEVRDHARRCPKTMAALAALPQPQVARRSPAAMFSVLQAKTRIPPHNGVANTRLVVHLPLVVPEACGFRVGNDVRAWSVGQAWVFDDCVEHEAWNDSDERRVILIGDVWNPYLSEEERGLVAQVMAAMDDFSGAEPGGDGL